jgi:hypothetical protein
MSGKGKGRTVSKGTARATNKDNYKIKASSGLTERIEVGSGNTRSVEVEISSILGLFARSKA